MDAGGIPDSDGIHTCILILTDRRLTIVIVPPSVFPGQSNCTVGFDLEIYRLFQPVVTGWRKSLFKSVESFGQSGKLKLGTRCHIDSLRIHPGTGPIGLRQLELSLNYSPLCGE